MFLLIMARETEIGWLLGCSKSEGCEYCFAFLEGRSGWMRSMKKKADKNVFSGSNLSQEKRWAFGWGLCQKSRGCTQRPFLQWSDSPCTQGSRICVLFYKRAWIHCPSLLVTSSECCILGGCFTLRVLLTLCECFIGEESECPRKQFTPYSLWDQRHEMLDLFEEPLLSQSLQPTLERRF